MSKRKTKIQKQGSLFWLILWLILFFPLGILYYIFKYRRTIEYEYLEE